MNVAMKEQWTLASLPWRILSQDSGATARIPLSAARRVIKTAAILNCMVGNVHVTIFRSVSSISLTHILKLIQQLMPMEWWYVWAKTYVCVSHEIPAKKFAPKKSYLTYARPRSRRYCCCSWRLGVRTSVQNIKRPPSSISASSRSKVDKYRLARKNRVAGNWVLWFYLFLTKKY